MKLTMETTGKVVWMGATGLPQWKMTLEDGTSGEVLIVAWATPPGPLQDRLVEGMKSLGATFEVLGSRAGHAEDAPS